MLGCVADVLLCVLLPVRSSPSPKCGAATSSPCTVPSVWRDTAPPPPCSPAKSAFARSKVTSRFCRCTRPWLRWDSTAFDLSRSDGCSMELAAGINRARRMLMPTGFFFFTLYSSRESWAPANIQHHFHVRYDRELRQCNNSVLSAAEMLHWSSSDSVKSTLTHVVKTPRLRLAQQFVHKRSRPTSRPTRLFKSQKQSVTFWFHRSCTDVVSHLVKRVAAVSCWTKVNIWIIRTNLCACDVYDLFIRFLLVLSLFQRISLMTNSDELC